MLPALTHLGGDRELFEEVFEVFLANLPSLLAKLEGAVSARDALLVRTLAHGLKGSASSLCAEPTRRAAERLEQIAQQGELAEVEAALAELKHPLDALRAYADTLGSDRSEVGGRRA